MSRNLIFLLIHVANACYIPPHSSTPEGGSITYVCHSNCGGLADRIRGISAAFMYSLILNRTFHIDMPEMHLNEFLQPSKHVPWDSPAPTVRQYYQAIDNPDGLRLCEWPQHRDISISTNVWSPRFVLNAACTEWQSTHARHIVNAFFRAPPNAQGYILEFPCIGKTFHHLFRLNPVLLDRLRAERARLPNDMPSVGVHFRAGDSAMFEGSSDQRGHSLVACLHEAETIFPKGITYLVSDSLQAKTSHMNATILVSPAVPFHVDKSPYDGERIMSVFVDLLMLASMNAVVLTSSGFGALAALIGGYGPKHVRYC